MGAPSEAISSRFRSRGNSDPEILVTEESPGPLADDYYTAADGAKIFNEGQKELYLATQDGRSVRKMKFQVAQVSKAFGSVSQMVDHGNRVVFDTDHQGRDISHIENKKTGKKVWWKREDGVYVLDVLVGPPGYRGEQGNKPGFIRQGR